jgi:two-component system, NtrC family, sensor kinase
MSNPEATPENDLDTILVVEDEPINIDFLRGLLQDHYQVRTALGGEAALREAVKLPLPNLILLDILMPGMDGFEVLHRLRANPVTRDIPVIFVTALIDEDDEQKGLELGAVDYIHKPINDVIVLSRIRTHLQARMARDMLHKQNQQLEQRLAENSKALEQSEQALIQSEKMAAMGQLAAGVAHEINNPVGFVSSNLQTLDTYLQDLFALINCYEQVRVQTGNAASYASVDQQQGKMDFDFLRKDIFDLLRESKDGIARVRKIIQDLKDFSHADDAEWLWADIHKGLDSTLNIVWNELKYKCKVTKCYGDLPQIKCLPSQLNQVFVNLLVNAAQAIETQGDIVITTERAGSDAVKISFHDTGKGIPPDIIEKIFAPFFTTKPVGKGTGLGLSVSSGIIERHQGKLEVTSEVGKGTTFVITLPIEPVVAD